VRLLLHTRALRGGAASQQALQHPVVAATGSELLAALALGTIC